MSARPSIFASRFPRQRKDPYLCIADFFRSVASGDPDYAAFHIVTIGCRSHHPRA